MNFRIDTSILLRHNLSESTRLLLQSGRNKETKTTCRRLLPRPAPHPSLFHELAMLVFCHVQIAVPVIVATTISVAMIHVGLLAIVFFRVIAAGMSLRHDQSSLTTMAGCVDCIVSTTKDTTSDEVTPSMPSTGEAKTYTPMAADLTMSSSRWSLSSSVRA